MSNLRFQVVEEAFKKRPLEVEVPKERPSEYFGKYVFTRAKMYKYLPAAIYTQLTDVEQEQNGIYYYDRTPKFDMKRIKAIFERIPSIIENPQDLSY